MNNFANKLKQFFKNKNTVTILGVIVIIALLYFGYTYTINRQTEPVRVPVATQAIDPRTEITADMIEYKDISSSAITENVITNSSELIGKYSSYNTVIPAGSMFYTETIIEKEELPDIAFTEVKEGEIVYNFSVDMNSTFGNSIMPGNYIDIFMKAEDTDGKVMVGKLIENIEVLAMKDSSVQPVFESVTETRTPSMMIFGLEPELYILLKKASYMNDYGVELYPVPHGGDISVEEGTTRVSTQYLRDFINANTVNIPIENTTDEEDSGE